MLILDIHRSDVFFFFAFKDIYIIQYFTIYNFRYLLLKVLFAWYIIYRIDVRKHNMNRWWGIHEKN
jgi:hypothetical protein